MKKTVIAVVVILVAIGLYTGFCVSKKNIVVAADNIYSKTFTDEVIEEFDKQNPGIKVKFEYDSSAEIKRKIENGEKIDVFLSADVTEMDSLDNKSLVVKESIAPLWTNNIVLIVPKDSISAGLSLENLDNVKGIAISNPDRTQVGQDAQAALTAAGIWEKIKNNTVYASSEQETLVYVMKGEVEAGFIYASTAASSMDKVTVVGSVSEGDFQGAAMSAGIVSTSKHTKQAQKFIDYLKSEKVKQTFSDAGFTPVND